MAVFRTCFFHTSGKTQTERGATCSSAARWDLLLWSWQQPCRRGRLSSHHMWSHPWWKRDRAVGCCFRALSSGSGEREPQSHFYLAVRLDLCNNSVLKVQGEINTEPNLPWEYLSKFLNEYSLAFSCSSFLLGPSWP